MILLEGLFSTVTVALVPFVESAVSELDELLTPFDKVSPPADAPVLPDSSEDGAVVGDGPLDDKLVSGDRSSDVKLCPLDTDVTEDFVLDDTQ